MKWGIWNAMHQSLEEIRQMRTVLDQNITILTIGEVLVAQIGPGDEDVIVKHADLHVEQSDNLVPPFRHVCFPHSAQIRCMEERNFHLIAVGL